MKFSRKFSRRVGRCFCRVGRCCHGAGRCCQHSRCAVVGAMASSSSVEKALRPLKKREKEK